ncbi:hypothetical protein SESBI_15208 [Sesbania bispinosa]|nr:hypothetical protein SESBI_15208 [Sesbania bispinosa]
MAIVARTVRRSQITHTEERLTTVLRSCLEAFQRWKGAVIKWLQYRSDRTVGCCDTGETDFSYENGFACSQLFLRKMALHAHGGFPVAKHLNNETGGSAQWR